MAELFKLQEAPHRLKRTFLVIINTLAMISLACAGFSSGTIMPAPATHTPSSFTQSTTLSETLPPVIMETSPMEGSEIYSTSGITLFFNQPMNRETVEASFKIMPALSGKFEWLDENRALRFLPSEDLPLESEISVTVEMTASAINGLPLPEPAEFHFRTPKPLKVTEHIPALNDVNISPDTAIVAAFNQPVVPLGAENERSVPAFTLTPEAEGQGQWLNTSTYAFYPDPPLQGGISYRVQMNPTLASTAGALLDKNVASVEWVFTTAPPRLVSVEPDPNLPLYPDSAFKLIFNQPMERASIEQNLKVLDASGEKISGSFAWADDDRQVSFQPDILLAHNTQYTLTAGAGLSGKSGSLLSSSKDIIYLTTSPLAVQNTNPAQGELLRSYSEYTSVVINFNNPLKRQKLDDFIRVEPAIYQQKIYAESGENVVYISGIYEASTTYKVTILPTLQDRWGNELGQEIPLTFITAPASPSFTLPLLQYGDNAIFILPGEPALSAQAINIPSVRTQIGKLTLPQFIELNEKATYERLPLDSAALTTTIQQTLNLTPDRSATITVPLAPAGQPLASGLYFINLQTPGVQLKNSHSLRPFLGVSSHIHLLMKRSPHQMFIWAMNLQTQQPIAGETIVLYDNNFNLVSSGVTNEEGVVRFPLPGYDSKISYYAVTGEPGQENFGIGLEKWDTGITSWDFNLPLFQYNSQNFAYLYTDRPLYQPGQTVNFRAILRQEAYGKYTLPDASTIPINILGEYSPIAGERPLLTTLSLPVSPYGTANGSFKLPPDAPAGNYSLILGEPSYAALDFQVAVYKKPEFEIKAGFVTRDQVAGEKITAKINANYYFGAPAGNLKINWVLYARPESPLLPDGWTAGKQDNFGFSSYSFDYSPFGQIIQEGETTTLPDGTQSLKFSTEEFTALLESDQRRVLTLEVTAQDESQMPVSGRAETILHPGNFYIGVKKESWTGKTGVPLGFQIQTIDWESKPSGRQKLFAELQQVTWESQDPAGLFSYRDSVEPVFTPVSSVSFETDALGRARLEFIPPEPGLYQLEVTGENALTQTFAWVAGHAGAFWPQLANQQLNLTSNASEYSAGETANIFIPNPFSGKTNALITFEKGEILQSFTVEFEAASYQFDLPVTAEYAPNGYLSVTLLGKTAEGDPDFRSGYLKIAVKPETQLLKVEVTPQPTKAAPGGEVTLNIQVSDWENNPVQGEFSVALVDKALLALTEPNAKDIQAAFYDPVPLGISTSLPLAAFSRRSLLSSLMDGKGGGGMGPPFSVLRSNFQDTAFWSGSVETDTAGMAFLTLKLPDNLTTWVITVRGLTKDSRVGEASAELTTGKDLMLRPVTPLFLVVGDKVELAAIVHNNTSTSLDTTVSLQPVGFVLADSVQETQKVNIPPGEHRRVAWYGSVQDVEKVELVFNAQAGDLQDAARPESGSLPVLKYSSPQTYAVSGTMSEEGDRLEVISLPASYSPTGGSLTVELSSSLAAAILSGLEALKTYPTDLTEANLSRLLANVQTYRVLKDTGLESPSLRANLETAIQINLKQILRNQNTDGGWGWIYGQTSNDYLSAYILLGLTYTQQAGIMVNADVIQKAQGYLTNSLQFAETLNQTWELDRLVLKHYALAQSGLSYPESASLYTVRDRLNPWSKALLALLFYQSGPADERALTLLSDLKGTALRTASGAHWEETTPTSINLTTPNLNTAIVVMTLAAMDPASDLLTDAVRYLIAHRRASGGWYSSYDSAWTLLALNEVLKGTGDLQSTYSFSASLNDQVIAQDHAGGITALTPVIVQTPLSALLPSSPNALHIQRGDGIGKLYYRAALQIHQPVEDVQPLTKGLSIQRRYFISGEKCGDKTCTPVESFHMKEPGGSLLVNLTLTLSEAAYYLVVEDFIPAGAEIVNASFKTSQLGEEISLYNPRDPFEAGFGWWYFDRPQTYQDHIRWMAEYIPAGSYELVYRILPNQPGQFHVIPAHAYAYYFPEFEGSSAGQVFEIR
ncbi:MAG: Ig-like domain-containing protein [Anaerolineaceae bacterium]|nr:Ig-like domain-containing protein [Anaerolineaceae bacterium]